MHTTELTAAFPRAALVVARLPHILDVNLPSLFLAVFVTLTGCGPNLEVVSLQQTAQLVAEVDEGMVTLRVHPLNPSSETCPDLTGATATHDGVEMTARGGGFVHPAPAPFPTGGCMEFTWTAPFDAAHDPSEPVTFTLRQGHESWQLVALLGAPLPIAVTEAGGYHNSRAVFAREPVNHDGRPIGTSVRFQATGSERAWVESANEFDGKLSVSIPFDSAQGDGTLEFRTIVDAEVTRCTGPASCQATYSTVQLATFTIW